MHVIVKNEEQRIAWVAWIGSEWSKRAKRTGSVVDELGADCNSQAGLVCRDEFDPGIVSGETVA